MRMWRKVNGVAYNVLYVAAVVAMHPAPHLITVAVVLIWGNNIIGYCAGRRLRNIIRGRKKS